MSPGQLGDREVRTVFLDRDGTINRKAPEGAYVSRPAQLSLLPAAAGAVARLNGVGITAVLVTNQRWLARPGAAVEGYPATHARLVELLAAHGAQLDGAYHCPHERDTCDCRKPAPGLLLRAARDLHLDLAAAVIIGDAVSDVAAGRAAGTGTILLRPVAAHPDAAHPDAGHPDADLVAPDLSAAVDVLLSTGGPGPGPEEESRCAACG